jgi:chromosome segregation ATPase
MYEVLKQMQEKLGSVDLTVRELKAEMQAFRGHMISLQTDVHNIYTILDRHDARLERIEKRLELADTTI